MASFSYVQHFSWHMFASLIAPVRLSRRASIASNSPSAYSEATSLRHMISNTNPQLEPPNRPFASNTSLHTGSSRTGSPFLRPPSALSLTINYLPTKFSDAVLYNGLKNRGKGFRLPKRGGGREAFRSGEARMPGEGDEDYDGVQGGLFGKEGGRTQPRLRWNKFKWTLCFSNLLVSVLCPLFFGYTSQPQQRCPFATITFLRRLLIAYLVLASSLHSSPDIPLRAQYFSSVLGLTSGNMPTSSEWAITTSSSFPRSQLASVS